MKLSEVKYTLNSSQTIFLTSHSMPNRTEVRKPSRDGRFFNGSTKPVSICNEKNRCWGGELTVYQHTLVNKYSAYSFKNSTIQINTVPNMKISWGDLYNVYQECF